MSLQLVKATGLEALKLATELLQRARRADPLAGLWEAADVQWAWRVPRQSDEVEKLFWIDDQGPLAGILLTSSSANVWQCDPIVIPSASGPEPATVWNLALEHAAEHASSFDIPVGDDDRRFQELARRSGLSANQQDTTAWLDASSPPAESPVAEGFVLTDRSHDSDAPHPMRHRNGADVAQRLEQCSLYDPTLDVAVETVDGRFAGYSLYWFDPTTKVGLVEPVRVDDDFQRRGLARAMLTTGIARLIARGARRVKISYETEAAGNLYRSLGFQPTTTTTWYRS